MYNKIEKTLPINRLRRCQTCINWTSITPCHRCNNERYIDETKIFKIQSDKRKIVFKDDGNEIDGYRNPGDIELNLTPKQHPLFEIDDYDIISTKHISLYEAYTGTEVKFKHLNGNDIINFFGTNVESLRNSLTKITICA